MRKAWAKSEKSSSTRRRPTKFTNMPPNDDDSFTLVSTDGGATWSDAGTQTNPHYAGRLRSGLRLAESLRHGPDQSAADVGRHEPGVRDDQRRQSWTAISGVLSTSSDLSDQYIAALAIAPSSTNTIYAATADGQLFVTQNNGGSWTEVDTGLPVDSYDQIVSIQVDPTNANEVFIVPGRFPTNVFGAARVWMTTTGGAKVGANNGWTEITGNLPSEDWTNSIAVDWRPATPVLYVATARGVYQSADLGVHWSRFGEGLPNSPVTDLQLDTGLNVLAAATYGRGVWEIELGSGQQRLDRIGQRCQLEHRGQLGRQQRAGRRRQPDLPRRRRPTDQFERPDRQHALRQRRL